MIIGFTGKKQTGKSTASKYISDKYDFKKVNFKDEVVNEIKDGFPDLLDSLIALYSGMFGMTIHTTQHLFEQKPPLVRKLMQNFATDIRRKEDPYYWVDKWSNKIGAGDNIVVDDVRFQNEVDRIHGMGGVIVRLMRPDISDSDRHVSETEMDTIVEDETIHIEKGKHDDMYKILDGLMAKYNE